MRKYQGKICLSAFDWERLQALRAALGFVHQGDVIATLLHVAAVTRAPALAPAMRPRMQGQVSLSEEDWGRLEALAVTLGFAARGRSDAVATLLRGVTVLPRDVDGRMRTPAERISWQ